MKYLKKFNEELKSSTYRRASLKLKEIGHPRRSTTMSNWADETKQREDDDKYSAIYNNWKPYGSFEIDLIKTKYDPTKKEHYDEVTMSGNFLITSSFEADWARDMFSDSLDAHDNFKYGFSLPFELGIIPADDETKKVFKEKEELLSDEVYDGMYWCSRIWFNIIESNGSEINPSGNYQFEAKDNDKIVLKSRAEAIRFKKLFSDSIEDKNKWGTCSWEKRSLGGQVNEFFSKKFTNKLDQEAFDKLMDGAYEKLVNVVRRMSINPLYRS